LAKIRGYLTHRACTPFSGIGKSNYKYLTTSLILDLLICSMGVTKSSSGESVSALDYLLGYKCTSLFIIKGLDFQWQKYLAKCRIIY
jgi:hypothetical protein